jgi:uncharacterized repeat protein (TIGR02543 family)
MKNLYKVLNIFVLAAVIAILGGCFSPWEGDGATITIHVGGGSGRTTAFHLLDDDAKARISYILDLSGPSNMTDVPFAPGTQTINLSVTPGIYTITVTAYLDGEVYATGSTTAEARAGQYTPVNIFMRYAGETTKETFTVTFISYNGIKFHEADANEDGMITRPENPTWDGYGFVYWYIEGTPDTPYYFDTPVTSDITLYAKWSRVIWTVTFKSNDGSTLYTEDVGDSGTLPPQKEDPILDGFVFGGWYLESNTDFTTPYDFEVPITNNITLCAKWKAPVFDDITDLGAYLFKWSANTPAEPYTVSLTVDNISTLRATLNANAGKYVYLDLSGSNIETIPDNTFYGSENPRGCATLAGITISDGVEIIGNYAFRSCANLASIARPDCVETIGNSAFTGCKSLTEINVSDSNTTYTAEGGVLYKDKTTLVAYPSAKDSITILDGVTTIGQAAFSSCIGLTSVNIPDGVETIGNNAFTGCTNLNSVIIGSGVTTIGNNAFSSCANLNSVIIGSGVTTIGNNAFTGCTNFASIAIPDSVETIGNYAFTGCTNLASVTIGNGVTSIGDYAFNSCPNLTSITLNANIEKSGTLFGSIPSLTSITIGSNVTMYHDFRDYPGLTTINVDSDNNTFSSADGVVYNKTVTTLVMYPKGKTGAFIIPSTVINIMDAAFYNCTSLTSITIGSGVTSIPNLAFGGCTNLTSITLNANIENSVPFRGLPNLASVTIGSDVTTIRQEAFTGCNKLDTVIFTLPSKVTTIGNGAFAGCTNLTSVTIPASVTTIGSSTFIGCTGLTAINIDAGNTKYSSQDGVLYNEDKTTLVAYPSATGSITTIPNSVTSIGDSAFAGCTSLTSITIPSNVTKIEQFAFNGCTNLISVTFQCTIAQTDFSANNSFPGGLRVKYLATDGGIGTYTTTAPVSSSSTWAKQP